MGRRRKSRKKLMLKPKKTLPKVFTCPHCGAQLVNVKLNKKEGKVLVNCGNCGLQAEFDYAPGLLPVDYFNKFVDLYYQGIIKPTREVTVSLAQLNSKEELKKYVGEDIEELMGGESGSEDESGEYSSEGYVEE
ncbi:hypothetical protein [Vulcanisaeta thermophila]|uniref:hypothetical protein n=1 Tax=Vulcanisaeta thermophila TaxID=867917 RepID=UPI00085392F1|nr:hypothetical protein [Vulcanisaeta thermophila]